MKGYITKANGFPYHDFEEVYITHDEVVLYHDGTAVYITLAKQAYPSSLHSRNKYQTRYQI